MALNVHGFLNTVQMIHTLNLCVSWDVGLTTKKSTKTSFTFFFFSFKVVEKDFMSLRKFDKDSASWIG